MSQESRDIRIVEVERDRCARITESAIRRKPLTTPTFSTYIKTESEFKLFQQLRLTHNTANLGAIVVPYPIAEKTLKPMIEGQTNQTGLFESKPATEQFIKNTVLGVDPFMEYMRMTWRFGDLLNSSLTPVAVKQYLLEVHSRAKQVKTEEEQKSYANWFRAYHLKFWIASMNEDPSKRVKLVSNYLDIEQLCGADYFVPPCPLIESIEMLHAAIEINKRARAIKRVQSVATYFLLSMSALSDKQIMKELIEFLTEHPTKITIIKIKNLDLFMPSNHTTFNNYVNLLREVDLLRRSDPERLFFIWENGYQAYPTLVAAFDSVCTSIRGLDKDGAFGRNREQGFSQWYHPKYKVHFTHTEVLEMAKLNGNTLMDNCAACQEIVVEPSLIIKDNWNPYTKRHYLLTWNGFIEQVKSLIIDKNIQRAREEIIEEAVDLRKFKEFIPTY